MKQSSFRVDPRVKEILLLLSVGGFVAASLVFPGLPLAVKPFLNAKRVKEASEWKKYNQWRLRAVLRRLKEQKIIEFADTGDAQVIRITEKGKKKVLSYKLEEMHLDEKWDGRWRLVIYDVPNSFKRERDLFRMLLKKLKFFPLQKSVYLTPYPCEDEVEYLRQTFGLSDFITVLKVSRIENDQAYREYFGI